jgi:hypothetical protein
LPVSGLVQQYWVGFHRISSLCAAPPENGVCGAFVPELKHGISVEADRTTRHKNNNEVHEQ